MVTESAFVLDTNVISALRVPRRNPEVAAWAAALPRTAMFVAAPTLTELRRGIMKVEATDRGNAARLMKWFEDDVLTAFATRTLPLDAAAALRLAEYPVPHNAPLEDALIACIADVNGMTVATRNTKHFAPLGVAIHNPWTGMSIAKR